MLWVLELTVNVIVKQKQIFNQSVCIFSLGYFLNQLVTVSVYEKHQKYNMIHLFLSLTVTGRAKCKRERGKYYMSSY